MSVLQGMSGIRQLDTEKQRKFESFYQFQLNHKLRPMIADFSLVTIWIGSLFNIFAQLDHDSGWSDVHPLSYLYCASLIFLGIANYVSPIRRRAPLTIYIVFTLIMVFAFRDFIVVNGWADPVFGVSFALAFVGYMTVSVRHTLILWLVYIAALLMAHSLIYSSDQWPVKAAAFLSDRFVFGCLTTGLLSACFIRWLFRNLFAMQFLLNDKNEVLAHTLKTLKSTEQQLIQQQKYQALNHMAKGLLHEIINPVNSASQALQYAQSVNEDEDVSEALDDALSQQQRISDILSDLRRFARSEIDQALQRVSVRELTENSLKLCHREIKQADVRIELSIDEKQLVSCHPSALTQVFVNLLLNACTALKEKDNGAPRVIRISSFEREESLSILFRDNGAGIDPASLKQIMDPFFSKGNSPETMGLGLSICQTIMRHHNGSMTIDSQLNEWTEVELILPFDIRVSKSEKSSPEFCHQEPSGSTCESYNGVSSATRP